MTWMTKDGNGRVGHFVENGVPICSLVVDVRGTTLAPFKCTFVAFEERSHLCSICRREEAKKRGGLQRRCECGKCGIQPTPPVRR